MSADQEPGSASGRRQPGEEPAERPGKRPAGDGDAPDLVDLFADDELSDYVFREQRTPPEPAGDDRLP